MEFQNGGGVFFTEFYIITKLRITLEFHRNLKVEIFMQKMAIGSDGMTQNYRSNSPGIAHR